jgi:hypothetical protein
MPIKKAGTIEYEEITRFNALRNQKNRSWHTQFPENRICESEVVCVAVVKCYSHGPAWQITRFQASHGFGQRQYSAPFRKITQLPFKIGSGDEGRRHPGLSRQMILTDPMVVDYSQRAAHEIGDKAVALRQGERPVNEVFQRSCQLPLLTGIYITPEESMRGQRFLTPYDS